MQGRSSYADKLIDGPMGDKFLYKSEPQAQSSHLR